VSKARESTQGSLPGCVREDALLESTAMLALRRPGVHWCVLPMATQILANWGHNLSTPVRSSELLPGTNYERNSLESEKGWIRVLDLVPSPL